MKTYLDCICNSDVLFSPFINLAILTAYAEKCEMDT